MTEEEYFGFRTANSLEAGRLMWQIFPPILIVIGTVGNILSIVVLSRKNMNKSAYSMYLITLAVADICMLYIGLLRQWIKYFFDIDVRSSSAVVCKLHWWFVYSNADICAWILTTITLERLSSALCPTKMKVVCIRRNAKYVIVGICLIFFAINSHLLYGFGRREIHNGNETIIIPCAETTTGYSTFFGKTWSWVDLCKASLLPFAILSFGNACIIWKLVSSNKRTQRNVGSSRVSISKLLVALNFVFITCTAPVCIYFIGAGYWIPEDIPKEIRDKDPWWALVNLLLYTNNTTNFALYCMSGSRFRRELQTMFKKTIRRRNTVSSIFVSSSSSVNGKMNASPSNRHGIVVESSLTSNL